MWLMYWGVGESMVPRWFSYLCFPIPSQTAVQCHMPVAMCLVTTWAHTNALHSISGTNIRSYARNFSPTITVAGRRCAMIFIHHQISNNAMQCNFVYIYFPYMCRLLYRMKSKKITRDCKYSFNCDKRWGIHIKKLYISKMNDK